MVDEVLTERCSSGVALEVFATGQSLLRLPKRASAWSGR